MNLSIKKALSLLVLGTFCINFILPPVFAQNLSSGQAGILNLPTPGVMVTTSIVYTPPLMAGMTIHPDNPLKFDFIISTGDDHLEGEAFRNESQKLINYFLATLTVPDDEMWVNLSPYEKDRIIAEGLGRTEMGRDMLIQDYMLNQLTASLMYPEQELGDQFWKKVYAKARSKFGTTEIPTNTFNKVWIVPEEAVVYVNGTNVFVSQSRLKVMLEEDYLALERNQDNTNHGLGEMTRNDIEVISQDAKELIREVILPEIEREVNEGKNFANLRQIYHSMILAAWYKKNFKESILDKVYMNRNKVEGINLEDAQVKEKIYNQYIEAFQKGVYDYIKEDYDALTQEIIPRKYFSGGLTRAENVVEGEELLSGSVIARAQRGEAEVRRVELETPLADHEGRIMILDQGSHDSRSLEQLPTLPVMVSGVPSNPREGSSTVLNRYPIMAEMLLNLGNLPVGAWIMPIMLKILPEGLPPEEERSLAIKYWNIANEIAQAFPQLVAAKEGRVIGLKFKGRIWGMLRNTLDENGAYAYREKIIKWLGREIAAGSNSIVDAEVLAVRSGDRKDPNREEVGGIDFNPDILDLKEQGQQIEFNLDNTRIRNIQPNSVQGIVPVIINITPIVNFTPLLGANAQQDSLHLSL